MPQSWAGGAIAQCLASPWVYSVNRETLAANTSAHNVTLHGTDGRVQPCTRHISILGPWSWCAGPPLSWVLRGQRVLESPGLGARESWEEREDPMVEGAGAVEDGVTPGYSVGSASMRQGGSWGPSLPR